MLVKHSERTVRKGCRRCGMKELYWAHNTDDPAKSEYCSRCDCVGNFVLVEKDGITRHVCGAEKSWSHEKIDSYREDPFVVDYIPFEEKEEESKVSAEPAESEVQTALGLLASALAPKIDRSEIEKIVKTEVSNIVFPTRTVLLKDNEEVRKIEGASHHKLADVVTSLMAGEHVMMVGPAGTGKSTIAEQAAEALQLPSYSISLSPQTPASQLLGYMQATGEYVPSLFRKAYEEGGVFHFDEVDNAHPSVLATINAALANGHMAFPDQMVKRHDDFRAVASANTYGRGATRQYVGRQAIDAATLDRFSIETIEIDEALENDLCHSTGLEIAQVDRVLKFIRKLRKNAETHGMTVVVSPRASVGMCRLIRAGRSWESAVEARVRRGLSEADWNKING